MGLARVAIIFDNCGPYHWARLEAAGRVCELLAVEVRDNCREHGWIRQPRHAPFKTMTLVRVAPDKKPLLRDLSARMARTLAEFKPQAVFLPGWSCAAAFIAHNWCNRHSVPVVVMSESNSWDEKRSVLKEWIKRRLARMYAAALVGGTTHKDYMVELGLPPDRVFLGYDAVDNDYFAQSAREVRSKKDEVRSKHGLPEKYFLASARFVEKKNLPRLIEAYARYRELAEKAESRKQKAEIGNQKVESKNEFQLSAFPISEFKSAWDLVLLGDGPIRSILNSQLSTLNLHDHVHMPGFKQYDELPAYYGLASAFIHASSTEQWGLVVNEAMASGLPVLVSNRCGCATDLVQEGKNGFTFDPCNVEQLAQLMHSGEVSNSASEPSTLNSQLSTLGAASHEIISHWSPERFGHGVSAAVERALEFGAPRTSLFDKFLLQLLAALK